MSFGRIPCIWTITLISTLHGRKRAKLLVKWKSCKFGVEIALFSLIYLSLLSKFFARYYLHHFFGLWPDALFWDPPNLLSFYLWWPDHPLIFKTTTFKNAGTPWKKVSTTSSFIPHPPSCLSWFVYTLMITVIRLSNYFPLITVPVAAITKRTRKWTLCTPFCLHAEL